MGHYMQYRFLLSDLRLIKKEWQRNYRFQGGLGALIRCVQGTSRFMTNHGKMFHEVSADSIVECITFSVIPRLTSLWAVFMKYAMSNNGSRVVVGDCSGGFRPLGKMGSVQVIPFLNYQHGKKLDLFLKLVCVSEYVIISDDDVFWLDEEPLNWALRQFVKDSSVAVISLFPRDQVSHLLRDRVERPMGSYCLIVRRETWLREELSFEIVYPFVDKGHGWFYDTADLANLELIKRGYKVIIAPPEIRRHLVSFEGTSSWSLKIQQFKGNIYHNMVDIPLRQEKALRTVEVAMGLANLIAEYYPDKPDPYLIHMGSLLNAKRICEELLPGEKIYSIRESVQRQLAQLREHLDVICYTVSTGSK